MAPVYSGVTNPISMTQYAQTLPEGSSTRIFVENMVAESDLLRAVKIQPAVAGKREFMDIGSLPGVGFRAFNGPALENLGTFNLREEDTFIIDDYIKVDRALKDRLGPNHEAKQVKLKSTALSQYWSQIFIKGDNGSDARQPNGIQVRCNNLGYNLAYNVPAGQTSPVAGGSPLSLTALDQLYWLVNKPTHWLMPRGLMPFWDAAARNNQLTNMSVVYDQDPDLGHRIIKFKGLPILFGYEPDDTPDLLPFAEVGPGGGAAVTGSAYCLSLHEDHLYGIEQTPLTITEEGRIPGIPYDSIHVKWDWGIAREHPRSAARLSGITQAAIVA